MTIRKKLEAKERGVRVPPKPRTRMPRKRARDERMKKAFGTDPDHQCKVCDHLNAVILELIQELRVRMRPEYAMLVMLTCADRYLTMAAEDLGIDEASKQRGFLVLVSETVEAIPFPSGIKPGDFPDPGAPKERWDGMDALQHVDLFLIDIRGLGFVAAAQVCARTARALNVFIKNPELAYVQAFGDTMLSRQLRAAEGAQPGMKTEMQPGTEVVGVTLFGGVKRHGGALN